MSDTPVTTTEGTAAPAAAPSAPHSATPARSSSYDRPRPSYSDRGDRNDRGDRGSRSGGPRKGRRKVCNFCVEKVQHIDYKDVQRLRRFISERAKILPRRVTGTCARHQRDLTVAIKRARQVALLPFVSD